MKDNSINNKDNEINGDNENNKGKKRTQDSGYTVKPSENEVKIKRTKPDLEPINHKETQGQEERHSSQAQNPLPQNNKKFSSRIEVVDSPHYAFLQRQMNRSKSRSESGENPLANKTASPALHAKRSKHPYYKVTQVTFTTILFKSPVVVTHYSPIHSTRASYPPIACPTYPTPAPFYPAPITRRAPDQQTDNDMKNIEKLRFNFLAYTPPKGFNTTKHDTSAQNYHQKNTF